MELLLCSQLKEFLNSMIVVDIIQPNEEIAMQISKYLIEIYVTIY